MWYFTIGKGIHNLPRASVLFAHQYAHYLSTGAPMSQLIDILHLEPVLGYFWVRIHGALIADMFTPPTRKTIGIKTWKKRV